MTEQEVLSIKAKQAELEQVCKQQNEEGIYLFLTAVYDKRSEQYQNLMTTPSKAFAVRGFMDACKDQNTSLHKYPEDFKLVFLGMINQKTGKIFQKEVFETLVEASSVVAS